MSALSGVNSAGATQQTPRIVLYGVGVYCQIVVRLAARRGWPLIAAFNRAGEKIGKDLGTLSGLDCPLGVIVQDCDRADYEALKADIAIVSVSDRLQVNMPAYERLLGAGINVICHGGESNYPQGNNPELAVRIDELARANGVSFTGTSIWDYSRIWSGLLAAGPCVGMEALEHSSITDVNWDRPEIVDVVGLGYSPETYRETFADSTHGIGGFYSSIVEHVLVALGLTVTSVAERREPVFLQEPVYCKPLKRQLEPGESAGSRIVSELQTAEGVRAINCTE